MKTRAPVCPLIVLLAVVSGSACRPPGRSMELARWSTDHADPMAYACEAVPVRGSIVSPPDRLTAPEINQYSDLQPASALEIVRRLRPSYLWGSTSPKNTWREDPRVIVDRTCENGVTILQRIPAERVVAISYVTPNEAVARYGPRYAGGIILVATTDGDRHHSQ